MSCAPLDEEYYQRQLNIYSLLFQAYLDKYVLDSVDYFKSNLLNENTADNGNAIFVIAHICDLAKRDFALTLWKVFYDDGNDANTVKKMNRYLHDNYGLKYKIAETENIKKIRTQIKDARHGFIAHNLMNDAGRKLKVSDLFSALEDVRKIFNDLSLKTIDNRATALSDVQIYSISYYEKMGLDQLLMGVLHTPNVVEEGEK